MPEKPKVSVIMSTYNRADKFLGKAIQSVLSQDFKDFELLIVDDCSTDDTVEVVKSFIDYRIQYFKLDKNSGSDTKPKNLGLMNASGDYIAYIDDDCEWYPYHLDVLVKAIESNTTDLVYCDAVIYDADNNTAPQPAIALDFDSQFLLRRNYIDTNNVLHKKHLAFAVGGFDETLPKFIDWNMWVRMMKWGAKIERVPIIATKYNVHNNTKSQRVKTKAWKDPVTGMLMFEPTFSPSGCLIHLPYLGENKRELEPKVAIYTITYDRLDYTKEMWKTLKDSTQYQFDWFVFDNGSQDGTPEWLKEQTTHLTLSPDNKGITLASNHLIDEIKKGDYDIIIKVDNDAKFLTKGWLEDFVDLWKRNHMLYLSPYPEGLVSNPGGAPRIGTAFIGDYLVEVTYHIGGFVAMIDARAHDSFRWNDQFLHGSQDTEASNAFRELGYMPCYIPKHRVLHNDTTVGQHKKYPDYFERRKKEKTQRYQGGK